jgi:hypothetical protein
MLMAEAVKTIGVPAPPPAPVELKPELTGEERWQAKRAAELFKYDNTVSNARNAIKQIHSFENHEQAKLFVRSLKPKY